jgi:hypothetical protein
VVFPFSSTIQHLAHVVVADLAIKDGQITGLSNLTRVTHTTSQGTGSYFPAFFPDGSLFYISSAVPKTEAAPKRFTFTVKTMPRATTFE